MPFLHSFMHCTCRKRLYIMQFLELFMRQFMQFPLFCASPLFVYQILC